MSQFSASWRVAVRAGRRDLWRSKGRSALIAVMVGLPVMLTVIVSVLVATDDLTVAERLPDEVGNAQASATSAGAPVSQNPEATEWGATGEGGPEQDLVERKAVLEKLTGGTVSVVQRNYSVPVVIGTQGFKASLLAADAREPGPDGLVERADGVLPQAKNEIMVTPALRDKGAVIGSQVRIGNTDMMVVGVGRIGMVMNEPSSLAVLGLPDAFGTAANDSTFLIDRSSPVTWDDVKVLNKAGFMVLSKDVIAHPPADSELYSAEDGYYPSEGDSAARAVLAIAVTAIVIQIVLLAGPAFAVGVRRQRRDLALLAATGASPKQVRRIVLGQAIVVGIISSAVAVLSGLGVAVLIVRFAPELFEGLAFSPLEVPWLPIAAAIALGVIAAALAAYVPARQASHQEVAAVLAGRRGTLRSSRGWPVVGAVLAAVGLVGCFTLGRRSGGETTVAASTIAIVIGVVLLTPTIIGVVGRIANAMPLTLRLALRDTSRQRARSAPAIAAVMASVAGVTAFAIASSSDFEQSRRDYVYSGQPGRLVVASEPADLKKVLAAVSSATGLTEFIPIAEAGEYDENGEGTYVDIQSQANYEGISRILVADPVEVKRWGVELSPEAVKVLRSGGVVVAQPDLMVRGVATINVGDTTLQLPAAASSLSTAPVPKGPPPHLGTGLMTPETAKAHDIPYQVRSAISPVGLPPISKDVQKRAEQAAQGVAPEGAYVEVERGFEETFSIAFFALLGFGVVAVLVGTMTATGLALSDARPDFSTLAAIGAAPRTRRRVAGAQAIVLATIGTLLGILVGFGPGVAAAWPLTSNEYRVPGVEAAGHVLDIPWLLLAVLVLVVPLIAALAATVFTRSQLTVVRRLAQ